MTKNTNFSVRLDKQTRDLLRFLAKNENRMAGSYLRNLIHKEAKKAGLIKDSGK